MIRVSALLQNMFSAEIISMWIIIKASSYTRNAHTYEIQQRINGNKKCVIYIYFRWRHRSVDYLTKYMRFIQSFRPFHGFNLHLTICSAAIYLCAGYTRLTSFLGAIFHESCIAETKTWTWAHAIHAASWTVSIASAKIKKNIENYRKKL